MNARLLTNNISNSESLVFLTSLAVIIIFSVLPLEYVSPFFILFFGIMLAVLVISLECPKQFNMVFSLFTAAFLIRVLIAVFLYCLFVVLRKNDGFFAGDGYSYSLNGWKISELLRLGIEVNKFNFVTNFGSLSGTVGNYDFLNAFIYSISGYNPMNLFFINCLAGSLSVVVVFIISNRIFGQDVALISGVFCAFMPSFILWSTQNLKDPLTNLGVLFFLYFLIKLRHDIKMSSILLLFLSLALLYYVRIFVLIPLFASALIYFNFNFKVPRVIKLVLIASVAVLTYFLFRNTFLRLGLLDVINYRRNVMAYGNLAYLPDFSTDSISGILAYLPLGLFAVFFSPFPWQVASFSQIFVLPEMLVWYLLLPFAIKGVHVAIKNKLRDSYLLIITIIVFSIVLGIYEGNLGTLYRHKAVIIMLGYIFIGAGLKFKNRLVSI